MYVVVDEIVAVLQVLTFADTVGGNEHVYSLLDIWQQLVSLLGNRREERQDGVEVSTNTFDGSSDNIASDKTCV